MGGWFHRGQRFVSGSVAHPRYAHLTVERLEDRCLLSGYLQTNLVSDVPGLARFTDPNLVNPWGLTASPTGPFWVSDSGTGVSTLYDGLGQSLPSGAPLVVSIPGTPTGTVFNSGPEFIVSADGQAGPSQFLFATEDGAIAGWSPHVDPTHAIVAVDNSAAGAIYKGLTLGTDATGRTFLYATNFHTGAIDVFDDTFQAARLTSSFTDPNLPAGFAPFGIQNIGGSLYVTYARQDAAKYDDVSGQGNGFVDVFNGDGVLQQRLASGGPLNSPWGVALAPSAFGEVSQDLLVGNFGDGHINVFEPNTGRFLGQLADDQGKALTIDHLWGLEFGNGAGAGNTHSLFFNAGIDGQQHGLFGMLQSTQNLDSAVPGNDGSAGNSYGTPANSLPATVSADGPADQKDNYPLPPASGPAPRGEIVVQPGALPLLFPLKGSAFDLAPALLSVTEAPRVSPTAPAQGIPVVANGNGITSDLTGTPPTPDLTSSVASWSANSGAGQKEVGSSSDTGALDMLLSLHTQPDLLERLAAASVSSSIDKAPVLDAASPPLIGDLSYLWWPVDYRLAAAPPLFAAGKQLPETRPGTGPSAQTPAGSPREATASDTLLETVRRQLGREPALETADLFTVLLVTGGACLMLGLGHVARGTNAKDERRHAPALPARTPNS